MTDVPARLTAALADRYRIERQLGEGGMATVYLAADLKHDRKVAIKVLKPELAAVLGAERFLAEIRTTANLQHPHILPLFDSGEAGGLLWYAMPYVEGETLRGRLDREKQLPVEEAVALVRKVAGALQAAHDRGIVHRDMKPENILLGERGEPLVSDFGIALAVQEAGGGRLTETGLSLGTPYYMSPEQATGDRLPDARSDVYALGCVLYEALTGEPPFTGSTAQAVLGRILTAHPVRPTEVRRSVPAHVEAAVLTALEKTPADRFGSAEAFAAALGDGGYRRTREQAAGGGTSAHVPLRAQLRPFAVGALVTAMAAWAFQTRQPRGGEVPPPVVRAELDLGSQSATSLRISPDGSTVLLSTARGDEASVTVRRTDDTTSVPLDVDGIHAWLRNVTFGPEGRDIAYLAAGRLFRLPLSGGVPEQIASFEPEGPVTGLAWSPDGTIVFSDGGRLWRVPAHGGSVEPVPVSPEAGQFQWPSFLPDGRRLLVARRDLGGNDSTSMADRLGALLDSELLLVSPEGTVAPVGARGRYGVVTDDGFLVVANEPDVWAYRFDVDEGRVVGEPRRLASDAGITTLGPRLVDVSRNGVVAWLSESPETEIALTDRAGWSTAVSLERGGNGSPRFSPDGRRIAFARGTMGLSSDIWVWDGGSGLATRLTGDSVFGAPEWTSDGGSVVFHGFALPNRDPRALRAWRVRVGGGSPEILLAREDGLLRPQLLKDGRTLLFENRGPTPGDIWEADVDVPSSERRMVSGPSNERNFAVSADGKWLAFTSDRARTTNVYLRRLDADDETWHQVSPDGGGMPRWADTGELFFLRGDSVMSVQVSASDPPSIGAPRPLFAFTRSPGRTPDWDVSPDGQRFAFVRPLPGAGGVRLRLLVNALASRRWEGGSND